MGPKPNVRDSSTGSGLPVQVAVGMEWVVTELDAAGGASVVNEPEAVVDEGETRGW